MTNKRQIGYTQCGAGRTPRLIAQYSHNTDSVPLAWHHNVPRVENFSEYLVDIVPTPSRSLLEPESQQVERKHSYWAAKRIIGRSDGRYDVYDAKEASCSFNRVGTSRCGKKPRQRSSRLCCSPHKVQNKTLAFRR
jgi:hypothetical protein